MKLNDTLNSILEKNGKDFFINLVPNLIVNNLNNYFEIRPYQLNAFGRFVYYWEKYNANHKNLPLQLLFQMATGSGKTLVMAGLILYLYSKGYRKFLFFVNSTNIIEKTKDNFLNCLSCKYLFADYISILGKNICVSEVDNFQNSDFENINICFSTVQGLHSSLMMPKEESITFEDFENDKIVLIADEAHHINADTKFNKMLSQNEFDNIQSWENTITKIFNANCQNVLLEFTATADFNNFSIKEKYDDKLLFDYSLKQFRDDGYSKDVKTLQADLPIFERSIQAILLSQYRRKLFEKHGLTIKPVVLFKSKTIKESELFQTYFSKNIKELNANILQRIKDNNKNTILNKVFFHCERNNISLDNLCDELKNDFNEDKQISVNSNSESEEKQIAINTLENQDNKYRVIFAVDKLNEGWDVLNLFDIVRLYDTKSVINGKISKTTLQEAQLIGRGARYCPFKMNNSHNCFKRKFDNDDENEMKVCEELFYHASYNPTYIQELNNALISIGIKSVISQKKVNISENIVVKNTKTISENYTNAECCGLDKSLINNVCKVKLETGYIKQNKMFCDVKNEADFFINIKKLYLLEFGFLIIKEAINRLDFYRFINLKKIFPNLKSISEFITSDVYLAKIKLEILGEKDKIDNLTPDDKLKITINILDNISIFYNSKKV